jgi:hypothetical protein
MDSVKLITLLTYRKISWDGNHTIPSDLRKYIKFSILIAVLYVTDPSKETRFKESLSFN